jgi:hypothetical protein
MQSGLKVAHYRETGRWSLTYGGTCPGPSTIQRRVDRCYSFWDPFPKPFIGHIGEPKFAIIRPLGIRSSFIRSFNTVQ